MKAPRGWQDAYEAGYWGLSQEFLWQQKYFQPDWEVPVVPYLPPQVGLVPL